MSGRDEAYWRGKARVLLDQISTTEQQIAKLKDDMKKYVFCFQAEDGILDVAVTGVQTCALPIYWPPRLPNCPSCWPPKPATPPWAASRSEERRVGKGRRGRWWRDEQKKKKR